MRILLPVHHFPPTFNAGSEMYTLRLAKALRALGHEVEVVAIEAINSGQPDTLRAELQPYEGVPVWRIYMNLLAAPDRLQWNFDNVLLGQWFAEHIARNRPDVVHFQAGYLLGVAPIRAVHEAGVPSIVTMHDYWFLCPRHTLLRGDGSLCDEIPQSPEACAWCIVQQSGRIRLADRVTGGAYGALQRRIGLRAETDAQARRREAIAEVVAFPSIFIAPSHYLAARMQPFALGDRLRVLPLGVEQSHGGRQRTELTGKTNHAASAEQQALHVGYLGQVAQHKGVHLLIEAWRGLRGSQPRALHIHGGIAEARYARRLRALAGDDATIHFHGGFSSDQREGILQNLDMCVVPSIWFENRPFAIAEAHGAGVPVITARLGGMEEMVCNGVDGLHFAPGDAGDLQRTLQRLFDEPALLSQLQCGARAKRQATVPEETTAIVRLYEEAMLTHERIRV